MNTFSFSFNLFRFEQRQRYYTLEINPHLKSTISGLIYLLYNRFVSLETSFNILVFICLLLELVLSERQSDEFSGSIAQQWRICDTKSFFTFFLSLTFPSFAICLILNEVRTKKKAEVQFSLLLIYATLRQSEHKTKVSYTIADDSELNEVK